MYPLFCKKAKDFSLKTLHNLCSVKTTKISSSVERRIFFLDRLALTYIFSLLPIVTVLQILDEVKWRYSFLQKFEFLGLMIYSVYCSLGIISSWFALSWLYNFDELLWQ
ncbi:CFC_HP_G0097120.mRNA.1.CDS.1 [Saccharomyces cerevisiae]|nr:CFC_HP_G0097120.mRNA.1.CDS.1 [Saccharomyces cerevisiae]CAI6876937.1 CFC_HP_G0097120.mRNA.1.CDS.1 [Saccharomyces cerevisiae]